MTTVCNDPMPIEEILSWQLEPPQRGFPTGTAMARLFSSSACMNPGRSPTGLRAVERLVFVESVLGGTCAQSKPVNTSGERG